MTSLPRGGDWKAWQDLYDVLERLAAEIVLIADEFVAGEVDNLLADLGMNSAASGQQDGSGS